MKAVGIYQYGGPEVLQTIDLPEPHAGPGQVRIRVRAAAVNPADVMLRSGLLRDYYAGLQPPFIPGMDIAGTIDEVGDGAEQSHGWSVGQDVVAVVDNHGSYGGYSQYVVVLASSVARKPTGSTFVEASTFLMNALTARVALNTLALPAGATLGVTGGAGAFGGYVIQLAAAEGLRVVADAVETDVDLIRSFGASEVVCRGDGVVQRFREIVPAGLDAVADGALLCEQITPAIRNGGQIVVVRFWDGEPGRDITVHQINVRSSVTDDAAIARLAEQVEFGVLTLRVAAVFPADQTVDAHRMLDRGGVRGRIVLEF